MSSHWVFQATLLALGSYRENMRRYTETKVWRWQRNKEQPGRHHFKLNSSCGLCKSVTSIHVSFSLWLTDPMKSFQKSSFILFFFIMRNLPMYNPWDVFTPSFYKPEKASLCCCCHRRRECYVHPPQPVYCGTRSYRGSALMLTASAALLGKDCRQISSGSTSKKSERKIWADGLCFTIYSVLQK